MFEQAVLTNGPAGKRALTTFLGLTSQVALVSLAALVPMVWPQVLPLARLEIALAPPVPPGPKHLGDEKKLPARPVTKDAPWPLSKYQPARVPDHIATNVPEVQPTELSVPGSFASDATGQSDGVIGGVMQSLAVESARTIVPPAIEKPVAKPPVETAPVIRRYTQGGNIKLGALLHKAEPPYPAMAKAARVSGDVVLECVVGVDGRVHEVKVKSGNPLLVKAAVDAAWQWAYAPTQLNSVPIEIVTILTFSFKLN
jgi:protein TonB